MAIHPNTYNLSEQRNFPLADSATRLARSGHTLPMDAVVDMSLGIPNTLTGTPYLAACAVTPALASAVISVWTPEGETVLATVTAVKPEKYRHYQLTPMVPGVGGWIVFGAAVEEANDFRLQFDTAAGELAPGAVRFYPSPPVSSLFRKDRSARLKGDVEIVGEGAVSVVVADEAWRLEPDYATHPRRMRVVDGVQRPAVILQLDRSADLRTVGRFLGQCVDVTVDGCDPPPIRTLNRVRPDENGNIDVEIVGMPFSILVSEDGEGEGIAVECPIGLVDVCDGNRGLEPNHPYVPGCE